jgi:hypothetical protein
MNVVQTADFFLRWGLATVWLVVAFVGLGITYAVLPESTVDNSGFLILGIWAAIAYVVGHYGIWHR